MVICPSCGSSVKGDLCLGCPTCGARAVGPPLAKAEHALPSFGRATLACAAGLAMLAAFFVLVIAVLIEQKPGRYGFWTFVSAGEVAAWRVKWAALPAVIGVLFLSARIIRSIKARPSDFIGLRAAQSGLTAAVTVAILIAALIGITVPDRLRQRQYALEAAQNARGYALHRALLEYRDLHGTYPTDRDKWMDALRTLPDADGSIADALRFVDPNSYEAGAQVAAASTKVKPMVARGVALRTISATPNAEPAGVSFNTYKLGLPSEHRLLGSDDDFVLQDGVVKKTADAKSTLSNSTRPLAH